jgi:hypothetical protein
VDLEAVRATAERSFHLTRAPEARDPLAFPTRSPEPAESVVVSFPETAATPDTPDAGATVTDLWERRPLAPVIDLSERYRHQIRNQGPLRTAAFRSCSCEWVERPVPHRPKHAKCEAQPAQPAQPAEHVKPRRRRRSSRVRAYVSHPAGDLAPLALAVRSWIAVVGSGSDGGSAVDGPGLGAVA